MELCKGETEGLGPGTGALELEPLAHCKVKRMAWDPEMELRNLKPLTHCNGETEALGVGWTHPSLAGPPGVGWTGLTRCRLSRPGWTGPAV